MVSVDQNDEVIGFLSATLRRTINMVSDIGAINFKKVNTTFSIDFIRFLTSLFDTYNFNKIEWGVIVGNPAETLYDKIIKKYGGKVIGISHQSVKLSDGKLYDFKTYEIFKKDYNKHKKKS